MEKKILKEKIKRIKQRFNQIKIILAFQIKQEKIICSKYRFYIATESRL